MKLIVGLGNVGPRYAHNRHNLGFLVIDELAKRLNATPWHLETKFRTELAEAELGGEKLILAKPQTMMNLSGQAVRTIVGFYKDELSAEATWVIHDDIDLEVGEVKIKQGGGDGGQKGVESIARTTGPNFHRIRIGIGRNQRPQEPAEIYVLKDLSGAERHDLSESPALLETIIQDIQAQ